MPQYRMRGNAGSAIPGIAICLAVESEVFPSSADYRTGIRKMKSAHVVVQRNSKSGPTTMMEYHCSDITDLWGHIVFSLSRHRTAWLICNGLGTILDVIEWPHLLEIGMFTFTRPPTARKTGSKRASVGTVVASDPPTYIDCWHASGPRLKMCDLRNWVTLTDEELVKYAGLAGGLWHMSQDYVLSGKVTANDVATATALTFQRVWQFVLNENLGNFRPTIAGQSMAAYRHRFCPTHNGKPVIQTNSDQKVRELERAAYYGARCVVRFNGEVCRPNDMPPARSDRAPSLTPVVYSGPVYELDMNSAYPNAMLNRQFPSAYCTAVANVSVSEALEMLEVYAGVADVTLRQVDDEYPIRINGRTHWMIGRFRTTLCGPELIKALTLDHVTAVHRMQLYYTHRLFDRFVTHFRTRRNWHKVNGDKVSEAMCKSILVSLHGKFAQRSERWITKPGEVAVGGWGEFSVWDSVAEELRTYRSIGHNVQQLITKEEPPSAFPLIGAYVIAYFRDNMRKALSYAGGHNVYYEDADTAFVSQEGYDNLNKHGFVGESEMGKFKMVAVHQNALFKQPKHYVVDDVTVCEGLPHKAELLDDGRYYLSTDTSIKSLLSAGPGAGKLTQYRILNLPQYTMGRSVGADGWTKPLLRW